MKKTIAISLLLLMVFMLFAAPVFANKTSVEELYDSIKGDDSDSIAGRITTQEGGPSETEILKVIDERVSAIIATVRVLATIFAVIFLVWMGLIFFTAGNNPQKLMGAKTQIVFFFISMLFIFLAEPIVRFVLSWFLPAVTG